MTQEQGQPLLAGVWDSIKKPFIRKYDPLTLSRIEMIEEVPLALDSAMEEVQRAQNRDLPKERRPGDKTKYYRLTTPDGVVITSWSKQKIINSVIDNKRWNKDGTKIIPLFQ